MDIFLITSINDKSYNLCVQIGQAGLVKREDFYRCQTSNTRLVFRYICVLHIYYICITSV